MSDDRDPRPLFEPGMVDVDVQGLDDFAQLLRTELDANFKPVSERIIMEHQAGVTFGERNASGEIQAVRHAYGHCLGRAMQNLQAYINASEILIAAAVKIAASYREADALSAAKLASVESLLGQAASEWADGRDGALSAQRMEYEHRTNLLEGLA